MDNLNDITDDLLCLPGFLRRNLLLIRDLDLKSSSLFHEANKLSASVFGTEHDMYLKTNSSIDKLSTISAPSTASLNSSIKQDPPSGKQESASKKDESPETKTKASKNKHEAEKPEKHTGGKGGSSKRKISRDSTSTDDSENLFFEHTKQFDEIQNLRMQGIYVLQEKIDVNTQITTMLKYEYENLKSKFDSIYAEMDLKGQIPHELKMYIASNKKRFFPLGPLDDNDPESVKKPEERSLAHNQMDIATMFRNVVNNQNAIKEEGKVAAEQDPNEGKEQYTEHGSKLVNRKIS
ncbi:conserved hypothetical protein [Theileria orientalis strain Shintoku]|uniref:Inhibitor of growth protein N-terminal histone-binding domain-containing protein n=1 Tax=Theileria orientalis strain Shintoku TaxID=869250 RepID=J4CC65_THEOR|nr:conserved hypothetical protein [Theileria orientalis strain Shintoku]PVC52374.1 hypothetical protein MACL_00000831 [Theileria orientalis]BAM38852.1 conserved hypothetical protein [Theileria orientalis strain Shintoku]|eukprot:XP_009689153.1 conserved hypothetical protein [Theileria orientalis strain Shintoku]